MSPSIRIVLVILASLTLPAVAVADPELTWEDGPDVAGISIAATADGGSWIGNGWAFGAGGPGIELAIYWHGEWDDESIADNEATALAPLAPLTIPLLALIPKGALIGNETGMRVRFGATFLPGDDGEESAVRASFGFLGRSAPDNRLRSTSLAAAWLPELGVAWVPGRRSAFTMGWNPLALAWRVGARAAFEWRVATVTVMFPIDQGETVASIGTGISVELDLDPRH